MNFKVWFRYWIPFWRTYVLILTPLVFLPVLLSGSASSNVQSDPLDALNGSIPPPLTILPQAPSSGPESTTKSDYEPMVCAYVLLIMAVYWMTEALPLPITSLIPIVAFPLAGVLSTSDMAVNYMKATNFMFLGGLMMAIGVEHSGLHRRIALKILILVGTSPRMIMLGFMTTTAFLSMWISNTATVAMMLPIVEAVAAAMHQSEGDEDRPQNHTKSASEERQRNVLLIAVAYAANIGGTGVITGSPSNLVILEVLPPISGVNFATWMAFVVPLMLVNLALAWLWLLLMERWMSFGRNDVDQSHVESVGQVEVDAVAASDVAKLNVSNTKYGTCDFPELASSKIPDSIQSNNNGTTNVETDKERNERIKNVMRKQLTNLGKTSTHEWSILICFVILIALWEPMFISGWGDLLKRTSDSGKVASIGDATPALLMVMIIFALPTNYKFWPFQSRNLPSGRSPSLVNWEMIEKKLPWGVILLLGGGFALSDACTKTGLSNWLVNRLIYLRGLPVWLINLILSMLTTTVTEVVSNTATANILLPILKQMSLTLCQNPTYLVLTSVITCSYAFMLPVATAPNAIVFGASSMTTGDMMKAGAVMNVICVLTTNIAINTYGLPLFGLSELPTWVIDSAAAVNTNCTAVS